MRLKKDQKGLIFMMFNNKIKLIIILVLARRKAKSFCVEFKRVFIDWFGWVGFESRFPLVIQKTQILSNATSQFWARKSTIIFLIKFLNVSFLLFLMKKFY
jgi:hypothetical protein